MVNDRVIKRMGQYEAMANFNSFDLVIREVKFAHKATNPFLATLTIPPTPPLRHLGCTEAILPLQRIYVFYTFAYCLDIRTSKSRLPLHSGVFTVPTHLF